jgi:hypothetical protein
MSKWYASEDMEVIERLRAYNGPDSEANFLMREAADWLSFARKAIFVIVILPGCRWSCTGLA